MAWFIAFLGLVGTMQGTRWLGRPRPLEHRLGPIADPEPNPRLARPQHLGAVVTPLALLVFWVGLLVGLCPTLL